MNRGIVRRNMAAVFAPLRCATGTRLHEFRDALPRRLTARLDRWTGWDHEPGNEEPTPASTQTRLASEVTTEGRRTAKHGLLQRGRTASIPSPYHKTYRHPQSNSHPPLTPASPRGASAHRPTISIVIDSPLGQLRGSKAGKKTRKW